MSFPQFLKPQEHEDLTVDLSAIPARWFLRELRLDVTPAIFAGEEHRDTGKGWIVALQHRLGGLLTQGVGVTPQDALDTAIANIRPHPREEISA